MLILRPIKPHLRNFPIGEKATIAWDKSPPALTKLYSHKTLRRLSLQAETSMVRYIAPYILLSLSASARRGWIDAMLGQAKRSAQDSPRESRAR